MSHRSASQVAPILVGEDPMIIYGIKRDYCASKSGSLSFTVSLDSKLHHQSHANTENQIIMEGNCPGKRIPPHATLNDSPKGIQFTAILSLQISQTGLYCFWWLHLLLMDHLPSQLIRFLPENRVNGLFSCRSK